MNVKRNTLLAWLGGVGALALLAALVAGAYYAGWRHGWRTSEQRSPQLADAPAEPLPLPPDGPWLDPFAAALDAPTTGGTAVTPGIVLACWRQADTMLRGARQQYDAMTARRSQLLDDLEARRQRHPRGGMGPGDVWANRAIDHELGELHQTMEGARRVANEAGRLVRLVVASRTVWEPVLRQELSRPAVAGDDSPDRARQKLWLEGTQRIEAEGSKGLARTLLGDDLGSLALESMPPAARREGGRPPFMGFGGMGRRGRWPGHEDGKIERPGDGAPEDAAEGGLAEPTPDKPGLNQPDRPDGMDPRDRAGMKGLPGKQGLPIMRRLAEEARQRWQGRIDRLEQRQGELAGELEQQRAEIARLRGLLGSTDDSATTATTATAPAQTRPAVATPAPTPAAAARPEGKLPSR